MAGIDFKPHKYQEIAINTILEQPNVGLFLDMGLGKTVSTLTALDELINDRFEVSRVLIIAPKLVAQTTWTDEIDKWNHLKGKFKVSKILGSATERRKALENKEANLFLINRENVTWLVEELGAKWFFDCVVIDELSSFKSSKSKRFRSLRKVRPLVKRMIALTGTPAPNGLMDLWAEMYLLDMGKRLGRTLTSYQDTYFRPVAQKNHIVFKWDLRAGAEEQIWNRISDITISMKAVDWLQMPSKQDIVVKVELDKVARKKYEDFKKDQILLPAGITKEMLDFGNLPSTELDKLVVADQASTVIIKLMQMASGRVYTENKELIEIHNTKIEKLKEIVEDSQGQNILVFYNFKHTRDAILKALPKAIDLRSEETIRKFKANKPDQQNWIQGENVYLAHPASMGHGLNINDGGHISVWVDLTNSLELFQQANARLYRQGQKEMVLNYLLIANDTIDEDIYKLLESKEMTQDRLLEAIKERMGTYGSRN